MSKPPNIPTGPTGRTGAAGGGITGAQGSNWPLLMARCTHCGQDHPLSQDDGLDLNLGRKVRELLPEIARGNVGPIQLVERAILPNVPPSQRPWPLPLGAIGIINEKIPGVP